MLFSLIFSHLEQLRQSMAQFHGRGVRGHLVQILDPAERSFLLQGSCLLPLRSKAKEACRCLVSNPSATTTKDEWEAHQLGLADRGAGRRLGFYPAPARMLRAASKLMLHLCLGPDRSRSKFSTRMGAIDRGLVFALICVLFLRCCSVLASLRQQRQVFKFVAVGFGSFVCLPPFTGCCRFFLPAPRRILFPP